MKPVPTYELLLWEQALQQIPLHAFKFPAGNYPSQGGETITGEPATKVCFRCSAIELRLPFGPAGLEPATHELKK